MVGETQPLNKDEKVRLCRVRTSLGTVRLMQAQYVSQVFAPHYHEGYCLGVIERGALAFRYMGERVVAPMGAVNLAIPGEVHTGQAADEAGWTYRMLYLETDLLVTTASQMTDKPAPMPFIRAGVLFDDDLARMIHCLHRQLADPGTALIEKESQLLAVLVHLIHRHGRTRPHRWPAGRQSRVVDRSTAYIHDHFDRDVSIRELAAVVGLSPYHFIRVFRGRTGLTPHAFLTQLRVKKARELLSTGESPGQAAVRSGFFDQSHLTRHFKRITGVTPGHFRNSVQDSLG